jgi:TolB protein
MVVMLLLGVASAAVCWAQADAVKRFGEASSATAGKPLQVRKGGASKLKVAVADLDSSRPDGELQSQYDKTMRYDLDFSDFFEPLPISSDMASQHRQDQSVRAIDYSAWQRLGAELLVKSELDDRGGRGTISLYAYDVNDQISVSALKYDIAFDTGEKKIREVRRAIHNFVDGLVQKYDVQHHLPGCAHTYIAFENAQWRSDTSTGKKKVREVFIMDYDGRNIRQITQDRDLCLSPSWSPDGRKLAYTSFRQSNPDLYVYNLDSGKIRVLAAFPGMNGASSWNPDGNRLAVTLSKDGNPEIYAIGADGTGASRLTRSRTVDTSATWSPDGSAIFFISDRNGAPQIMRMSASGGNAGTIIRGGQNDDPSVSPTGDSIAYTSSMGGGGFNVWVADISGGNARSLTGDLGGNCEHPTWAPDGRHLVFVHNGQVVVMDADGSDKRYLTGRDRLGGENAAPAWGP